MTGLALSYRPLKFADVVGQKHVRPILRAMCASGQMPPAMIFTGSRGTGKTSTARIVGAALNCERPADGDACAECPQCVAVQNATSFNVMEIDAASNGLVEDIRKLKQAVLVQHGAGWHVILLDEAHSMRIDAFNALLKVLEEPPPRTLFILLTTEANKIPETVVSRSMRFEFRRLSVVDIVARLEKISSEQEISATPELMTEIAVRSQGGLRDAVVLLDQISRVGVSDVEGFRELFGLRDVSEALMLAALAGDHAKGYELIEEHFYRSGDATQMVMDLVSLVRDVLTLKAGGTLDGVAEAVVSARKGLGERVATDGLIRVVKTLWDLKGRTRAVDDDQRAAMELAFVLIADALAARDTPIPSTNGNGKTNGHAATPRLSVGEMRELAKARR